MTHDADGAFQARMSCLPQATGFVAAFCARCGVSRDDELRLTLMVEELFTNTVCHGHGGDSDALVRVGLAADASRVELSYEDATPPFDPLRGIEQATADLQRDVALRPLGGMGIPLVLQMAASVRYERQAGLNRLWLVLRRAP